MVNVRKYTIHGWYGIYSQVTHLHHPTILHSYPINKENPHHTMRRGPRPRRGISHTNSSTGFDLFLRIDLVRFFVGTNVWNFKRLGQHIVTSVDVASVFTKIWKGVQSFRGISKTFFDGDWSIVFWSFALFCLDVSRSRCVNTAKRNMFLFLGFLGHLLTQLTQQTWLKEDKSLWFFPQ